jgi:hypothetical protein
MISLTYCEGEERLLLLQLKLRCWSFAIYLEGTGWEGVGWINLALDRKQWRAVVK